MKILAIADIELNFIYNPTIADRFHDVDLVIGCGDLSYYYMEYIVSMLNVPLYFVRGNHASDVEIGSGGERRYPWGAVDIHRKAVEDDTGLLLAGLEGSVRYNQGPHQYTQAEMWLLAFEMVPKLLYNKARHGRYLDILITHAPPWKIHDADDRPHQGAKAFRWLIQTFKPAYHMHGHVHVYKSDAITMTQWGQTTIMNAYGYKEFRLDLMQVLHRFDKPAATGS